MSSTAVKVDVFTMDAQPCTHKCRISRGIPHPPFDWNEQRYCIMHTEIYEALMRGADLEQYTHDFYNAGMNRFIFTDERAQMSHANNLMFCLRRMHKRNAYRVAILASWFKADGDHAIAHRVGTFLGKLVDWADFDLWHFP